MAAKLNNNRKYPDANHQPRHKAADRIMRAQVRQEVYNELTLEQKIAALPPEPYSKRQRARLLAKLAKQNTPKSEPKNEAPKTESSEVVNQQTNARDKSPRKYMKGK